MTKRCCLTCVCSYGTIRRRPTGSEDTSTTGSIDSLDTPSCGRLVWKNFVVFPCCGLRLGFFTYALIHQVRERDSHCPRPRVFRSTIVECTGAGGMDNEDNQDFCAGWHKWGSPNCTIMDEFKYTSAASLNSSTTTAKYLDYGGGGYVFKIRGYISDLEKKIQESTGWPICFGKD